MLCRFPKLLLFLSFTLSPLALVAELSRWRHSATEGDALSWYLLVLPLARRYFLVCARPCVRAAGPSVVCAAERGEPLGGEIQRVF